MTASSPQRRTMLPAKIAGAGRRWLGGAVNLLFPPACSLCNAAMEDFADGPMICDDCQPQLVSYQPACPACGTTLPPGLAGADDCAWCRAQKLRFNSVVRLGRYDNQLRQAVLSIKHPHQQPLTFALAEMLHVRRGGDLAALGCDVVVPIPMYWTRRLWRGVNNPEVVGQRLAAALKIEYAAHLLVRSRHTEPQADLSSDQRRKNVHGAFRAARHRNLPDARVLLVDDILTTGATASEAARMLKQAGAAFVAVAGIARAEGGHL